MKRAGALIALAVVLASLAGARADDVFGGASAGPSAGASWTTDTLAVSVAVFNSVGTFNPTEAGPRAYISIYPLIEPSVMVLSRPAPRRSVTQGCWASVALGATDFSVDPMLSSATLDVAVTPCGRVHVSWTGTGDPVPNASVGASNDNFFGTYVDAGAGAGVHRDALATGSVGAIKLTSSRVDSAVIALGAGAGAELEAYDLFTHADLFRGMSIDVHTPDYDLHVSGYEMLTRAEAGSDGANTQLERIRACAFYRSKRPSAGRMPFFVGCGPATLTFDPQLGSGRILASWRRSSIDVSFTANGEMTPENELDTPPATPSVDEPIPEIFAYAAVYTSRAAVATGTLKNPFFGSLGFSKVKGVMCEGAEGEVYRGYGFFF